MVKKKIQFKVEKIKNKSPSLEIWINNSLHHFTRDIDIIEYTNQEITKMIKKDTKEKIETQEKKQKWTNKDIKEYRRVLDNWSLEKEDKLETKNPVVVNFLSAVVTGHMRTMQIPTFVREMSLVYLVTNFEGFLEEIIKDVYRHDNRNLKSKKELRFEEILECSDMKELIERLASKEVTQILNEDIEKIGKYLEELVGIKLTSKQNWAKFKELFYRRNVIIHNDARVNPTYVRKTGYIGTETRLKTDETYIQDAIKIFKSYSKLIVSQIKRKYKKTLKQEKMKLEK